MERHPLRIGYLVAGIVFVAVAVVGLAEIRLFRAADLSWVGPGLLVLLGVALVVGTATRRNEPVDEPVDESVDETAPGS